MSDRPRVLALAAVPVGSSDKHRGRLRHLDTLRVLTCLSVIAMHAVSGPYPPDAPNLGAATSILHYSREIFFFVSALVLVRTYVPRLGPDGRLPDEAGFRRRRLKLIGVPYLIWTAIYLLVWVWHVRGTQPMSGIVRDFPLNWVYHVFTGNGCYHLYFLLVTCQFAVIFPWFLRFLGRTQGRHGWVLTGSLLLQVATLCIYHLVYLPEAGWRALLGDSSLFAYQLWMVAGALAGLHLEKMHDWIMSHQVLVLAAVPVGCAALLWSYWAQVPSLGVLEAATPLQPSMIVWSTIMLGALYLAAVRLSDWRSRTAQRAFAYVAQLSFGIYLAHPLMLDLVLSITRRLGVFGPHKWLVVVSYVLVIVLTVGLCAALHRTPLSLALMGRGRHSVRPVPAASADGPGEADAAAAPGPVGSPDRRLATPSATR